MMAFERYAPAMVLFYLGCAAVPAVFGVVVWRGGSPVTPEIYGPVVYAIPALTWAATQFSFAMLAVLGAAARWPVVAALGAGGIAATLGFLAVAAALAGATGTLVVAGCGVWLAPVSSVCAVISWRDRGYRDGR